MNDTEQKKRIVLLTDCLADLAGGAEKQIYELAKGLDKSLYDVFVVSLDTWGEAPRDVIEAAGSQLHVFKVVRVYGLSGLRQGIRFKKFLKDNNIDVLLTYHFSSDMWGTFWGHLAGVKTIISNRRDMGFWRNNFHVLAYKLMNNWVNKIVVVSDSIKSMVMTTEKIKDACVEVIYNGVHLPVPSAKSPSGIRSNLGLKAADIVIMHVANLKPIKGHQYLLEAFAHVIAEFPQCKLVLIGKDEMGGKVQEQAKSLNILEHVLFLGKQDNVPELLEAADICVLPSLSEGMSNSILEYMAAGKPVIATNVGGNPELINDAYNGCLVDKANAAQLKEALKALVRDKETREKMGRNGRHLVEKEFAMPAMVKQYERLFGGIRVLHLISSGGLFGAERVILNLAARAEGVTPFVGALNNKHNPHLEIITECKRLNLKHVVFDSSGQVDIRTVHAVKRFLIDHRIDLIHTHNYKSDIIGFAASKLAKKPWIATNHVWHSTDRKLAFYERIDAMVLKHARVVIGVSQEIKDDLLTKGFKDKHVRVVDNGITVEEFQQVKHAERWRSWVGLNNDVKVVVIVGRLAKEKGHEVFLNAAAKVLSRKRNVKFVVVGDGPLRGALKNMTDALGISEHVLFVGLQADMPKVYAASNVLVNSSFIEGLPMTILEAMAARLPIIATKVGAVGKVIEHDVNGILLEPGDPDTLAEAIEIMVSQPETSKRYAERAFSDVCAKFSDRRMAKDYMKIYNEVISS